MSVGGWRICRGREHAGPRWQPVTSFGYRGWDHERDEPRRLASWCFACERERSRQAAEARNLDPDPLVDATSFRVWLGDRCVEYPMGSVASSVGVTKRRVVAVLTQRRVRLSTVDRWAAGFGDNSTTVGY